MRKYIRKLTGVPSLEVGHEGHQHEHECHGREDEVCEVDTTHGGRNALKLGRAMERER